MSQAKNGDTVKVNFTGRLDSGQVFDSTENREPFEFVLGQSGLISGFEQALLGMSPGESKTVKLSPEQAYGPRREELLLTVEREQLPEGLDPQTGQTLQLQQQNGQPVAVQVTQVSEANITLDANHPLAGKALTFEISLVELA